MSDESDTLRRAAFMLWGHSEAAPHGPWSWEGGYPQRITNEAAVLVADVFENPDMRSTIASYIAMVDPTVGLALADLLNAAADDHDDTPCPAVDRAVAVARAVLRASQVDNDL